MYLVVFSVKYAAFSVYLYNEIYLCCHWFHILPTTPFLLLSAALFFRGSPRLYTWLLEHKYLGPYIRSFREDRAIPLRAKIISVSLLWITAIHCVLFLFPYWWLKGIMAVVTIGVTIYILSFKTRSPR